jgi:hypothetical protein
MNTNTLMKILGGAAVGAAAGYVLSNPRRSLNVVTDSLNDLQEFATDTIDRITGAEAEGMAEGRRMTPRRSASGKFMRRG